MRFNRFIWELYAQSERGRNAVERFSCMTSEYVEEWCRIPSRFPGEARSPGHRGVWVLLTEQILDLGSARQGATLSAMGDDDIWRLFEPEEPDGATYQRLATDVSVDIPALVRDCVASLQFASLEEASQHYAGALAAHGIPVQMPDSSGKLDWGLVFPEEESDWYDYADAISLGLYWGQPEFFLPYHFRCRFNQVEEIHAEFGIPLPPVPSKSDTQGRTLYYLRINEVWQEFRLLHGLTPGEMCAFLYDFAPQFTTPANSSDLPSPSKAWLITGGVGGNGDSDFADAASAASVTSWNANLAVRRGDILMMYLVSPRSCIHSVWRACSDAFEDPFFYYRGGTVWISSPTKTAPVTYQEMKQHPLLSHKPAVRARFQGLHGKAPLTVEEYEAVLEIMAGKGQDLEGLPGLPSWGGPPSVDLHCERDVEVHLVEPFLARLGYSESDWIRQMPVKMGRGERNYPDYAFGANARRGEESAAMLLEAKYQLSTPSGLTDAFYQAKSYALRLQSRAMALAAKEGIWVFAPANGRFQIGTFVHKSWGELNHPDAFHEVLRLIGRDTVLR